jgi:integrase
MALRKITQKAVEAARPTGRQLILRDTELRGFGLRITQAGAKSYVVEYRLPGAGRGTPQKRLTLGSADRLTADEARKMAQRQLAAVVQGNDPAAVRAKERAAATVATLGGEWLADVRLRRKATTATEYARLWRKHVAPVLGGKKVAEVTTADVRRLHRQLNKTPYVANRVVAMLGAFFTYAEQEAARPPRDNPAYGVKKFPEQSREAFLSPEQYRALGEALGRAEQTGLPPAPQHRLKPRSERTAKHRPKKADTPIPANPYAVAAIRLLAFTGCREGEILSLKWSDVDIERGHLRLSDSKTGKSVRRLNTAALDVLQGLPRQQGSPYVLPGARAGEHVREIRRTWYAVRHAAGLDNVRLHDLRHSFASTLVIGGESLLVVRSLLGHASITTTERYAHLSDDPVRLAAERAGSEIASLLSGSDTEVTPLRATVSR